MWRWLKHSFFGCGPFVPVWTGNGGPTMTWKCTVCGELHDRALQGRHIYVKRIQD